MGVWINSTRDNQLTTRIDEPVRGSDNIAEIAPNKGYRLAVDQNVGGIRVDGRNNMPAFDQCFHRGKLYDTPRPE
jgi:hypothetical protein